MKCRPVQTLVQLGNGAFQVIASRLDDQVWHDDHLVGLAAARLTVL